MQHVIYIYIYIYLYYGRYEQSSYIKNKKENN